MQDEIRVHEKDFDVAVEYAALRDGAKAGAVAMFVGLVRDFGDAEVVREMFLEHYPGMTGRALARLVEDARGRWALNAVRIVHRVGGLLPADQIVFVGVASAHRESAFAACEFLMDRLKTEAPFWKRETDAAGASRWVGQKETDVARGARWQDVEE